MPFGLLITALIAGHMSGGGSIPRWFAIARCAAFVAVLLFGFGAMLL